MREIRTRERITELDKKKEKIGYTKIKPVSDITANQARDFWANLFSNKEN